MPPDPPTLGTARHVIASLTRPPKLKSAPPPLRSVHTGAVKTLNAHSIWICVFMSCETWSWPKPVRLDQFWQSKVVLGQIMATKTGSPRTRFGSQKWSYLAKSGPRGGLVLVTKSGPGFGSQKWSWEKQFW